MERNKHRLNRNKSQRAVNVDGYQPISLENESRLLPFNDIARIINENEQFNKERQASTRYRVVTTINSVFSNPLFNVSGENSWSTFNEALFRDRSYPPNGISVNEEEDFTFLESIEHHLKEEQGWFGYYNPKLNETNRFLFNDMKPGRNELDIITKDGMNWDITFTYPAEKMTNGLTENGLDIIGKKQVKVGGKLMTAFLIPYKHNVELGDTIKLTGIGVDGIYEVQRIGLDNGDFKENYFAVDLPITSVELNNGKFQKIVNGDECEYYFRVFNRVNTAKGETMGNKDYDAFPLAFSKNIYGDPMVQVVTKNDIDVMGLVDNLGRPVTELYVTYIKKPNKGFSKVSAGLLINNHIELTKRQDIPDIRRIHNGGDKPFQTSTPLTDEVSFSDEAFVGDLVEYNKSTLIETTLSEIHHRFNTTNREEGSEIKTVVSKESDSKDISDYLIDAPIWHGTNPFEEPQIDSNFGSPIILFANFSDNNEELESYKDSFETSGEEIETGGSGGGGGFSYTAIYLGYHKTDNICSVSSGLRKYINSRDFKTATTLFKDRSGSIKEIPGFYTDGNVTRYWNGLSFTTMTTCEGADTCVGIRATQATARYSTGLFLGGKCIATDGNVDQTEYFLKYSQFYSDSRSGSTLTSCSYSTRMVGTAIDSFQFNGQTITNGENTAIRLVSDNYQHDGKTFKVYVKWNNIYDENLLSMDAPYLVCGDSDTGETGATKGNLNLGSRQEGYYYKPFHKIQIREFSSYLETGNENTLNIPSYAKKLSDGRYIWRDILDIGFNSEAGGVDYPFLNGSHHLYVDNVLSLKRQDPFSEYGLRAIGLIADVKGNKLSNKRKINKAGDVC